MSQSNLKNIWAQVKFARMNPENALNIPAHIVQNLVKTTTLH